MFTHFTKLRVRYAETDRMGYSYYGNYATYFEVARVEALRALGITYKSLEDEGILLPVVEYHVRFSKPAYYDDEIAIKTTISLLKSARIRFEYEVWLGDELLTTSFTELVFVDKNSGRPMRCPPDVDAAIRPFFPRE